MKGESFAAAYRGAGEQDRVFARSFIAAWKDGRIRKAIIILATIEDDRLRFYLADWASDKCARCAHR